MLELFSKQPPDLFIMDIDMPGMNGISRMGIKAKKSRDKKI